MIFSKKENNLVQVSNRSLFMRLEENKEIQCILEEGFIFLTERLNDQTLVDIFRRFRIFFYLSSHRLKPTGLISGETRSRGMLRKGEGDPEDVDDGGLTNQNEEGP